MRSRSAAPSTPSRSSGSTARRPPPRSSARWRACRSSCAKGPSTTGLVAILRGPQNGRTVLLRGDMDALPLREDTGLDVRSEVEGAMHACGHDTHVAMLVGAARALCAQRDKLNGHGRLHVPARRGGLARREVHDGGRPAWTTRGRTPPSRCTSRPTCRRHVRQPRRPAAGLRRRDSRSGSPARAATAPCRTSPSTRCRSRPRWCWRCRPWSAAARRRRSGRRHRRQDRERHHRQRDPRDGDAAGHHPHAGRAHPHPAARGRRAGGDARRARPRAPRPRSRSSPASRSPSATAASSSSPSARRSPSSASTPGAPCRPR